MILGKEYWNFKTKGIYGSATKKQINELQEEGIETHVFPWIDNKNN